MAMGPLESFVFPGVFVRTINESAGVTAAGDIRFPGFVGVSAEEIRVSDFEMVRGSSAIADNLILDEDVSSQFTGLNNEFTVANYPIVTGDGSGKVATSVQSVIVTVNSEVVAVNSINGLLGTVKLVSIPKVGDEVRANYYYKRRDTYIENESLVAVGDGTTTNFKVHSPRICKGDNGGRSATDTDINATVKILYNPDPLNPGEEYYRTVKVFEAKVDGVVVTVTHIDGATGSFTLQSAPASGKDIVVTYFTSTWQDTYDILPAAQVNRLVKVGLSQDTSDFSIGTDCVLSQPNKIHWGNSKDVQTGIYTAGSTPLYNNVTASLTDTKVYGRVADPAQYVVDGSGNPIVDAYGNKINVDGNKAFLITTTPCEGDGTGTFTEDPNDITVYIGATWSAAYAAGAKSVVKVVGNRITLKDSPSQALQEKVYVTYYESNIVDDTWTITNKVPGGVGVGKYTVTSLLNGTGLDVVRIGGTISPVYAGSGAVNTEVSSLRGSVERVTITFDGVGGFTVTSKLGPTFVTAGRTGSVTALNANKGFTGRSYIDPTTGFRVTFSNNTGVFSPVNGDTVIYDIGDPTTSDATEKLYVTAKTDIVRVIPGVNLTVSSTDGGSQDNTGDTVVVYTYNKSGNEPENGDMYYVSFDKTKTDYTTKFLTNMKDVIKNFGPIDINNKLTLAANLAFQNGARAVAMKQIMRASGESDATVQDYIDGIDAFNEPLPNGLKPSLIQPLSTNPEIHAYLKTSNAIQCSIRYRNERTSIIGFAVGTSPESVIQEVQGLGTEKVTPVYPDAAILTIADTFGNEVEYIVDGSMISAAVAGLDVSPVMDIATPLTNKGIVGFTRLYRRLDSVTASLVANAGCTVLQEQTPFIKILMYLTSDVSTVLTRDPRIVEMKHYIQQGVRAALQTYIGQKNLPKLIPQVADTLGSYFKSLKQSELIVDYTGIAVKQNSSDPSTLDVEAYYSPVFPLNWIVVTLNLRSSL